MVGWQSQVAGSHKVGLQGQADIAQNLFGMAPACGGVAGRGNGVDGGQRCGLGFEQHGGLLQRGRHGLGVVGRELGSDGLARAVAQPEQGRDLGIDQATQRPHGAA